MIRFFYWHYGDRKKKESSSLLPAPSKPAATTATQFSRPRPRHIRPWQVYMRMYYKAKISAQFEQEMERKYHQGVELAKKQRVKEQSDFVQTMYERESLEIKELVDMERSRLYNEAVKDWEAELSSSHSPEAIQRYVMHCPHVLDQAELHL